jgi:uncharacterized protein YoaH (UPF0181 family)
MRVVTILAVSDPTAQKEWGFKGWQLRHKIRASNEALIQLRRQTKKHGDKSPLPILTETCWGKLAALDEQDAQDALAEIQSEIANGASSDKATKKVLKRKRAIKKGKTGKTSSGQSNTPESNSGASGGQPDEEVDYSDPDNYDDEFRKTIFIDQFCNTFAKFIAAGCDGEELFQRSDRVLREMVEVNGRTNL